ncbi:DNA-methyltransferase [Streptococcus thermophilus]|uniref:DNA-methyltransferase n=1 Tax=Streptococcus thermophilus TaxID=1308 RepID=UPI001E3D280B|nr:site-specific DNA-methyltransferase [Streptococcus thermophilus]MCD9220276.1 site-specific DNA-methyltransferase [Streptococcus thermophilus]
MEEIDVNSVDLIITSPPYFNLVDYNHNNQIGLTETYDTYIRSLNRVWKRCIEVLKEDGTICINICSAIEISRKNKNRYYDIKHDIEKYFTENGFYIEGTVIWNLNNDSYIRSQVEKYPLSYSNQDAVILNNYEYILIFRKKSEFKPWDKVIEKTNFIDCIWTVPWDYSTRPPAFPEQIVNKLIDMYSMEKDVVLDPFMGQATTSVCAFKKNRNFLTYELNPETYSIGVKSLRQLGAFDEMP